MSDKPKDGGPAFPRDEPVEREGWGHPGMSLRDWFAGQALAGLCSIGPPREGPHYAKVARTAYGMADAMLKEREEENG